MSTSTKDEPAFCSIGCQTCCVWGLPNPHPISELRSQCCRIGILQTQQHRHAILQKRHAILQKRHAILQKRHTILHKFIIHFRHNRIAFTFCQGVQFIAISLVDFLQTIQYQVGFISAKQDFPLFCMFFFVPI